MEDPHIGIKLPDYLPDEKVEEITSKIRGKNLKVDIKKTPVELYAGVELTIPALIAIFIAQSYFGSFIKEMGKDHYLILKNWLKSTANSTRDFEVTTISANQSKEKLNSENTQSKVFSLHLKTKDGRFLKIIFDLKLTEKDWEFAIDNMIDLMEEHFDNYPNDKLTRDINNINTHRPHIYAIINPSSKEWEYHDHMTLLSKFN